MKCVFDADCAMKNYGSPKMKVEVKRGPKGVSLFARKPIRRGNIIAYYQFKTNKYEGYTGKKGDMYTMSVYTKGERFNPRVIGDVYEGSLQKPKYNIPFFAYFSNEPSGNQKANAELDINLKSNYRNRDRIRAGDIMVYKLKAAKNIDPGEEIVWCYGDSYDRDYQANCD